MQVLVPVPRELELDRIELKQKVISECAHQGEARVVRVAEFVDQRAEYGKGRGLIAAFLFRGKLRQWLQPAVQSRAAEPEFLPVRVRSKRLMDDPRDGLAAGSYGPESHPPA